MSDESSYLDARLHLLERQVLDSEEVPVCVIDDLELQIGDGDRPVDPAEQPIPGGPAEVTALVSGRTVLARIFGGRLPYSMRKRIRWSEVAEVGLVMHLNRTGEGLDLTYGERWLRDHVIGRIPGADHSAE